MIEKFAEDYKVKGEKMVSIDMNNIEEDISISTCQTSFLHSLVQVFRVF